MDRDMKGFTDDVEFTRAVFQAPPIDGDRARDAARQQLSVAITASAPQRRWPLVAAAVFLALLALVPFAAQIGAPPATGELRRIAALRPTVFSDLAENEVLERRFEEARVEEHSDLVSGQSFRVLLRLIVTEWVRRDG